MYEELINDLRHLAKVYSICENENTNEFKLAVKAADAIEELCGLCASQSKDCSKAVAKYLELLAKQPNWVPVTERLPDSGVHVLASCKSNGGCRYVCDAFYSAPKTEVCSYNDDIDMEYDEKTDEYYMPEGWWEVVKNWDEYSCIGIEDSVTHWMQLPEPPEGET